MEKLARGGAMALHNSSPSAVEEQLLQHVKDELGKEAGKAKIKPILEVEDDGDTMDDTVVNGYGAVQIKVGSRALYLPFMIVDKNLFGFDTIKMKDEEVGYDHAKLQKLVRVLDKREAEKKEEDAQDSRFKTMELADIEDVQQNNGFLGSTLNIRHQNRQNHMLGGMYDNDTFADMSPHRMIQHASEDVLETYHDIMEKIADTKMYTKEQLHAFEEEMFKRALEEEWETFTKEAAQEPYDIASKQVENSFIPLDNETLFDAKRAASGNNITFPVFEEGKFEFREGRVYTKFNSWVKPESDSDYRPVSPGFVVIDSHGNYRILKRQKGFMASEREPKLFDMNTRDAANLIKDQVYTLEENVETLRHPFRVRRSYLADQIEEGTIFSVKSRADVDLDNRFHKPQEYKDNSLFIDCLKCEEILEKEDTTRSGSFAPASFTMVVTKDESASDLQMMYGHELKDLIEQEAKSTGDARMAKQMTSGVSDRESVYVIPRNLSFFELEELITGYYETPRELRSQDRLVKQAAASDDQKVQLMIEKDREPKRYAVNWQFHQDRQVEDTTAQSLERKYAKGLSEDQATHMLKKLGFNHREQKRMFEMAKRNGRQSFLPLPDASKARTVSPDDRATGKAKQKMKAAANSMLNSKNFTPVLENATAQGISDAIAFSMPTSIDKAKKMDNWMSSQASMDTAASMEKIATEFNQPVFHKQSVLLNLKHHLDKMAAPIWNDDYVAGGREVLEKVATLKPIISKQASQLVAFNQEQKRSYSDPMVPYELVKQAMDQYDALHWYAEVGERLAANRLEKQAGLISQGRKVKGLSKALGKNENRLRETTDQFQDASARFRSALNRGDDTSAIQKEMNQLSKQYDKNVSEAQGLLRERGPAQDKENLRNMGIGAAVGVPGLAAGSYGYHYLKDEQS